jgi:LacI family transcriptional regulator
MSRRSLEQRFLKATGLSVYEFITKVRMDTFAELLLTTSDTVSQIAALMDEPDTKSISRRFAAIKGCTPKEYRRKYLRKMGE